VFNYVVQVNIGSDISKSISKIRIEHDGRIPGKGWHLDKACYSKDSIFLPAPCYSIGRYCQSMMSVCLSVRLVWRIWIVII